ncbi:hypothetical protein [Tunturibacter empetritectus]|uniref:Uncharacterized protein n=1 Tax=Tunturiibacter lichenicola TaxID=2051959 RepID=A0A7W8N5E1_9BACT|nr:hypothetical protein [Edaphobacter lichenicola]MBB5343895.1 hypothetical protein [Edaphobacter lichenicola]
MKKAWVFVVGCWLISCCSLMHGQIAEEEQMSVAPPPSARFPAEWYPAEGKQEFSMFHDTGAPYTAVMVTTVTFAASPGSSEMKSLSGSTFQARDSMGRTRTEESRPRTGVNGEAVDAHEVSVNDPVSHCSFQWLEPWVAAGAPTATVRCMPRRVQFNQPNIWTHGAEPGRREEHSGTHTDVYLTEALGERVIEGVRATGVRKIKTMADTDRKKEQTLVTEIWYSAELKEMVAMKGVPAEAGFSDFELKKIDRKEPDSKLFYPPDGYKIEHHSY